MTTVLVMLLLFSTTLSKAETPVIPLCEAATEIVPGTDEWLFNIYEFPTDFNFNSNVTGNLQRFQQAFADRGMTLVAIITPSRPYIYSDKFEANHPFFAEVDMAKAHDNYRKLVTLLNEVGILTPDLLIAVLEQGKDSYAFQRDTHWKPEGAELVAREIARLMQNSPTYKSLSKQNFVTTLVKTELSTGDLGYSALQFCPDLTLPAEEVPIYETRPETLLSSTPESVLLGTSFSITEKANFHGILSNTLSIDILNASIVAGGPINPLDLYFTSDRYRESPPKLVFWEFPSSTLGILQYDDFYRRIIPSIYGACTTETSLVEETVALSGQETRLLTLSPDLAARGSDYFIYTEFSDTSLTTFNLKLTGDSGVDETFTMRRSTRGTNSGRFFLELHSQFMSPLVSVAVAGEQLSGTATTRLCKK